jgi:dipeptidase D
VWRQFDDIRKIPRPSGKEEKIREHMKAFAKARGFEVREDKAGNVCIVVPATPGHEKAPTIVLQGHMDMVCEKNSDKQFDFEKDAIDVRVEGDWVKANGTTLGADNGLGLAAALAAAVDESVVHGPLELLFTVDEETGLTGAMGLETSLVTGRKLLNLDSEDDGVLFVGCAGGQNTALHLPVTLVDALAGRTALRVHVKGLRGGHSGLDIGENRANAIKLLCRTLVLGSAATDVAIGAIEGGSAHNAIPREASAVVLVADRAAFEASAVKALEAAKAEHGPADPDMVIEVAAAAAPAKVLSAETGRKVVDLVLALPHGVLAMSRELKGLVETSNNVATVAIKDGSAVVLCSSRSSVAAALRSTIAQLRAVGGLAGADVQEKPGYPGWQPNMSSDLLALGRSVFSEIWGKEPKVTAIHAGLECGLIGERFPGMDMLSFGPQLKAVHSPDERAQISSTARFWEAVKGMLGKLA